MPSRKLAWLGSASGYTTTVPLLLSSMISSDAFARLRSYLSSLHKQGVAPLGALASLFTGSPLSPAFA